VFQIFFKRIVFEFSLKQGYILPCVLG